MDLLKQIVARAKADKQRIVLPEAEEERTLRAADKVLADDIADIILIGNPANIKNLAAEWGLTNIDKATIVDPLNNPKSEEYAELLAELRKKKGMTIEQARELVKNNLYLGCMIIKTEGADEQNLGSPEHHRRHPAPGAADYQVRTRHIVRERCHAPHHRPEAVWQRRCGGYGRRGRYA